MDYLSWFSGLVLFGSLQGFILSIVVFLTSALRSIFYSITSSTQYLFLLLVSEGPGRTTIN